MSDLAATTCALRAIASRGSASFELDSERPDEVIRGAQAVDLRVNGGKVASSAFGTPRCGAGPLVTKKLALASAGQFERLAVWRTASRRGRLDQPTAVPASVARDRRNGNAIR